MTNRKLVGNNAEKRRITEILHGLGYSENLRGTQYLREAVLFYQPYMRLTKFLYPEVAKRCGTTSARFERCIRHATDRAFGTCTDYEFQAQIFGALSDTGEVPTVGQAVSFIWLAVVDGVGE